ncbi:MAG: hypothetical protein ACK4P3_01600 [Fimbriimonadaceae bacterium]
MSKQAVVIVIVVAILQAALMVWMSTYTLRITSFTPDSVNYLAVARSVIEGRGLEMHDRSPLVTWGPTTSLMYAAAAKTGIPLLNAPMAINLFCIGLTAFLFAFACYSRAPWIPISLGALLVSAAIPSVAVLYRHAWSEPIFISLCIAVAALVRPILAGRSWALFVVGGVLGLLPLTRYVGILAIPVVLAVIWFFGQDTDKWSKKWQLVIVGGISGSMLGLWILRNLVSTGTMFGDRNPPFHTVTSLFSKVQAEVDRLVPDVWGRGAGSALLITLSLLAIAGTVWTVIYLKDKKEMRIDIGVMVASFGIFATYIVFSVFAPLFQNVEVHTRYFATAWPLLILSLAMMGIVWVQQIQQKEFQIMAASIPAVIFGALAIVSFAQYERHLASNTPEYLGGLWRDGESLSVLERLRDRAEETLFTNAPEALYAITGRAAAMLPSDWKAYQTKFPGTPDPVMAQLSETVTDKAEAIVVDFKQDTLRPFLMRGQELGDQFQTEVQERAPWVDILRLRNRN